MNAWIDRLLDLGLSLDVDCWRVGRTPEIFTNQAKDRTDLGCGGEHYGFLGGCGRGDGRYGDAYGGGWGDGIQGAGNSGSGSGAGCFGGRIFGDGVGDGYGS